MSSDRPEAANASFLRPWDPDPNMDGLLPLPQPPFLVEEPGSTDCLVIIYAMDPTQLGQRIALTSAVIRVGRSAGNDIVLDDDAVSRHHAQFELRGDSWHIVDQGSRNGTYCSDEQILPERALTSGDRVKIGSTIFKLLAGPDAEIGYHDEIERMAVLDGLTLAHNKRFLVETCEREIARARGVRAGQGERPGLSLLVFDIDRFRRVNETYGHIAGDFVLRELARLVQARIRRDEVFARLGGEKFAVLLPDTSLAKATAFAESLREELGQCTFEFQRVKIQLTASVGLTALQDGDRTPAELLDRAARSVENAKRDGGDQVAKAPEPAPEPAPEAVEAAGARAEAARVSVGPPSRGRVARAEPSPLLEKVLARRAAENLAPVADLPFPIAGLGSEVGAMKTPLARVEALLGALTIALRFMVALELGALRLLGDTDLYARIATRITRDGRLDEASWEEMAIDLAALVPDALSTVASAITVTIETFARAMVDGAPLGAALSRAGALRASILRTGDLPEDSHGGEEQHLRRILAAILFAARPLGQLRLVSVAGIEDFEDEDLPRYALHVHRGPSEDFPVVQEKLPFRLQKGACYLISNDGKSAPLSLSPIVLSRVCDTCGRVEVAIADKLVLGPKGARVQVFGVTTRHEGTVEIPWQKRAQALYGAVAAASAHASAALGPSSQHAGFAAGPPSVSVPPARRRTEIVGPASLIPATLQSAAYAVNADRRETMAPPAPEPGDEVTARPAAGRHGSRAPRTAETRRRYTLFYCHAAAEEAESERLAMHLTLLQRQGLIEPWNSRSIPAVGQPPGEPDERMDQADIILLLLSQDFVDSDYCRDAEVRRALARGAAGEAIVLPILLRPCGLSASPFERLQLLPRQGLPVTRWADQDQAWFEIARELRRLIAEKP